MDSVLYLISHCHSPSDMRNSLPVFMCFFGSISSMYCFFTQSHYGANMEGSCLSCRHRRDKLTFFLCFYRPLPVRCFEIWFTHFSVVFAIHNFNLSGYDSSWSWCGVIMYCRNCVFMNPMTNYYSYKLTCCEHLCFFIWVRYQLSCHVLHETTCKF